MPGVLIGPISLCLFVLAIPIQAEVTTQIQATGYAAVHEGDVGSAYEQAKRAALREAVEEATGTLVSARSLAQNFSLLEDQVLTRTQGYVRSYNVSYHGIDSAMGYRVELDAVVDLGNLHKQLDALEIIAVELGNPRLACLATFDAGEEDYMAESHVVDRLVNVLLNANDQLQIIRWPANDFNNGKVPLNEADMAIAVHVQVLKDGPSLIPYGEITLEDIGIRQVRLETRIEVWWLDSGESVAQLAYKDKATALSHKEAVYQAFNKNMEALAEPLIRHIGENWRKKVYASRIVQLEIEAAPALIQRFEKDFPTLIGGIQGLQVRRYESRFAAYDVHATCAAFHIARQLSTKGLDPLDIEIRQVTANTLKLSLSVR